MCGHDDEIESVCPGELSDLCGCNPSQQDSRALTDWKLGLEERIKFLYSSNALLLFGNLRECPYIELEPVVTVEIEDMN